MTLKINEKRYAILLALLIIIGAFLRFYHLDYNSLWLDEAFTRYAANHSLSGIWEIVSNKDLNNIALRFDPYNPPLFYYFEHFMLAFGQSEFVLRFIPALLGVLTIPVFYLIGKEFADKNTGLIMAALLTVSQFHVYYSQEARAYSTMLFLFSVAFYFFLVSLRTSKIPPLILFGVFSALTVWTHYYTIVPIALLFSFGLFWRVSRGRNGFQQIYRYALAPITFLIICIPLVPLLGNLLFNRTSIPPLTWGIKGFEVPYQIFAVLSEYHNFVLALFLVLFVTGIFFTWRADRLKASLLVSLLVIPIIISMYLAQKMSMDVRYLFYLFPFFFLGISLSLKPLSDLFRNKNAFSIIVVLFFLFQAPFLVSHYSRYYTDYSKEDWRGISKMIDNTSSVGDFIFVIPYYTRIPFDIYYSNRSKGTFEFGVQNESDIIPVLSGLKYNQAYFVVTGHIRTADPTGSTLQWLDNNTRLIGSTRDIELYALNLSKNQSYRSI